MKIILFFLLAFSSLHGQERHKVCLNMIVKNESQVICRCLESVKPLIDYWVIVDTGSTDGTQQIIKEFMKDIPGELHERPWINFAHNRNEALSLAKETADYLFFIDADDCMEIDPDFIMPDLQLDGYYININYGENLNYSRIQFINARSDWSWGGVVHEALVGPPGARYGRLEGVWMKIIGGGDRSSDPKKFERDAQILEEALQEDPANTRNVFYLAQSYRDLGELHLALNVYERRVALGGWTEEVFWSLYQIALLHERMEHSEAVILYNYLRAYNYQSDRIEPLYRLANYYRRKGRYLLGYLIAQFALEMPVMDQALFYEKWMHQYGVMLEYSICAYWIGRYEEAYEASQHMLSDDHLPNYVRECVMKNLTFIIPRLEEAE